MPYVHPRTTQIVSFFLSYLLITLLCSPFSVSAMPTSPKKVRGSTQESVAVRYRNEELLVRFREGVTQKDKETILTAYGARRKKQLEGDSRLEKLELDTGRDAKTVFPVTTCGAMCWVDRWLLRSTAAACGSVGTFTWTASWLQRNNRVLFSGYIKIP